MSLKASRLHAKRKGTSNLLAPSFLLFF